MISPYFAYPALSIAAGAFYVTIRRIVQHHHNARQIDRIQQRIMNPQGDDAMQPWDASAPKTRREHQPDSAYCNTCDWFDESTNHVANGIKHQRTNVTHVVIYEPMTREQERINHLRKLP